MGLRTSLQSTLETILGSGYVYFQPPANVQMQYPCIVYKRDDAVTEFADGRPYRNTLRYQVTVIDRNPDSEIPAKVADLPKCRFDRYYAVDNLNHDVYVLYF